MSNQYPVNKSYGDKNNCYCGGGQDHKPNMDCKPEKFVFRCRDTSGQTLSAVANIVTQPVTIGTITVSDLGCFKKPCVRLDTLGVVTAINLGGSNAFVTLTYKIYKRCDHDHKEFLIKEITSPRVTINSGDQNIISQLPSICDCEDFCRGDSCCRYRVTVEALATQNINIEVGKGVISIIAGDEC